MLSKLSRYCVFAVLLTAALIVPPVSHADIVYSFSDIGAPILDANNNVVYSSWSWSFVQPTFITSNTTVFGSNLLSKTNPTTPSGYWIFATEILDPNSTSFQVVTSFQTGAGALSIYVPFGDGKIDHFGTYSAGSATLKVSPVPEPTSLLLLGSGFLGLAGLRKKLRK